MSKVLEGLYYSNEHEWVRLEGDVGYIGISDHAQEALGDIVYVDPGAEGAVLAKGDTAAVLESVKAASDVYTPVSGTVTAVNSELINAPERINQDAYGNYIFAVKLSDLSELSGLMDASAYEAFCQGEH